jgi:hypothetical protein
MTPPSAKPARVKVYGIFWMTRTTYLTFQAVGLFVVLAMIGGGLVGVFTVGRWLPSFELPPGANRGSWFLWQGLIVLLWVGLVTLVAEAIETPVMLKKFARAETLQRALEADPLAPRPAGPDAHAVQPPTPGNPQP